MARVSLLTGSPGVCAGSVVKGRLPQLGEKVLVKAAYNPGQAVPWNAVKVQTLSNQVFISPWHVYWKGVGGNLTLVKGLGLHLSKVVSRSAMGCPEFPGYCPAAPAEVPSTSPSTCGSPGPEARDSGSSAPADLPASPDSPTLSSEA